MLPQMPTRPMSSEQELMTILSSIQRGPSLRWLLQPRSREFGNLHDGKFLRGRARRKSTSRVGEDSSPGHTSDTRS